MTVTQPSFDPAQATRALCANPVPQQTASTAPSSLSPSAETTPHLCKADIARDDLTGLTLGPYSLGPKIGGGGMGKVFIAQHRQLDKSFAIKFIGAEVNHSVEARQRFDQEVKALGKLQHHNIVCAVDAGTVEGIQYLVTELVTGQDLAALVQQRGPLPLAEACELIRQSAIGLAHSHRCGFLHRDIKPSNLILNESGQVKILDFGLVRSTADQQNVTVQGEMLGTWDYVAPEQAHDARQVDERSDIYSLGCTLLYLLSGHSPFSDSRYSTVAAKLKGHLFDQPGWLQNPPANMPPSLLQILRRMLAKNPAERFQDAEAVAAALEPLTKVGFSEVVANASGSWLAGWRVLFAKNLTWAIVAATVMLLVGVGLFAPSRFAAIKPIAAQSGPGQTKPAAETPPASSPVVAQPPETKPTTKPTDAQSNIKPVAQSVTRPPQKTVNAAAIRLSAPTSVPQVFPQAFAAPSSSP